MVHQLADEETSDRDAYVDHQIQEPLRACQAGIPYLYCRMAYLEEDFSREDVLVKWLVDGTRAVDFAGPFRGVL